MASSSVQPILKIEGPPGSGKTRELAREACRLIAQEGIAAQEILILAVTPQNRKVLRRFLKLEATLAGLPDDLLFDIQTLDAFWLKFLQWNGESVTHLLSDAEAQSLLNGLMRRQPEVEPKRSGSFSRSVRQLFAMLQQSRVSSERLKTVLATESANDVDWLAELYAQWLALSIQADWMTVDAALQHLTACDFVKISSELTARYRVILADEVQEWPQVQHELMAKMPVSLVLSGHADLSIRSGWGAYPEAFSSLETYGRPVAFLPKQACMRGLEPTLSLLNRFLPKPIWEEQMADADRLKERIRFGVFSDPQQEAEAVVSAVVDWVRGSQVDDRPATWNDCVILLRSSYYRPILENALREQNVPFSSMLSEPERQYQQMVYDVLCVFEALQNLGAKVIKKSDGFSITWEKKSNVETISWLQQANRHTRRWLESMLESQTHHPIDWTNFDDVKSRFWLLELLNDNPNIEVRDREWIEMLLNGYMDYQRDPDLLILLNAIEPMILIHPPEISMENWTHFKTQVMQWSGYCRTAFSDSLQLSELLERYHQLWTVPEQSEDHPKLRICSMQAIQGDEAPWVAIPFMTADELPYRRDAVELLPESVMQALDLSCLQVSSDAEEARLFALGVSRAAHTLWLSTHQSVQGDREAPVFPSPFYVALHNAKQALLGHNVDDAPDQDDIKFVDQEADSPSRYMGTSAWACLTAETNEPLFDPEYVLSLSASAIHTYMTCPRQFYYRHLLKLPQPDSDTATLGTMIHRVMEVFNKTTDAASYTEDRLKVIAETFFAFEENSEAFYATGFTARDHETLSELGPLSLSGLKQHLLDAIDDLERKGYFATYRNFKTMQAEKPLENVEIDGIEGCRFSGKLDAMIQRNDGTWDIIDYKTHRRAYRAGLDTCDKHFSATLLPLPNEPELTPTERFSNRLNSDYPKDYQLPLYYLACAQNPEYQNRIRSVALQMVRPTFPENSSQGAIRLELSATAIEETKEKIIGDINRYIVQPIRSESYFSAEPAGDGCQFCAYAAICDDATETQAETDA